MPLEEFPFSLAFDGATEGPRPRLEENEAAGPVSFGRHLDAAPPFVAEGVVVIDGTDGNTYDDWHDFMDDHGWGADAALYRARSLKRHYEVADDVIGTATGGAGQSFELTHRDIDEESVEVRVAGVVQAQARWEINDNGTAPTLDTLANFAAGEVTISYRFFHRCRVVFVDMVLVRSDQPGKAASVRPRVRIVQTEAGGHLA